MFLGVFLYIENFYSRDKYSETCPMCPPFYKGAWEAGLRGDTLFWDKKGSLSIARKGVGYCVAVKSLIASR